MKKIEFRLIFVVLAMLCTAQIDFAQPLTADSPRLQGGWGVPQQVLQAHDAAQLAALLPAVQEAARRSAVFLSVPPVRRKDLPAPSRP